MNLEGVAVARGLSLNDWLIINVEPLWDSRIFVGVLPVIGVDRHGREKQYLRIGVEVDTRYTQEF